MDLLSGNSNELPNHYNFIYISSRGASNLTQMDFNLTQSRTRAVKKIGGQTIVQMKALLELLPVGTNRMKSGLPADSSFLPDSATFIIAAEVLDRVF